MSLTKPNQELRRDLEEAARDLFAGIGLRNAPDVMPTLERIEALHAQADRLKGYADEVRDGVVIRVMPGKQVPT